MCKGTFLLLPFLAACAAPSVDVQIVDPIAADVQRGGSLDVAVRTSAAGASEFTAELQARIRRSLREHSLLSNDPSRPHLRLDVEILHLAPGGAWGEEAECSIEVRVEDAASRRSVGRFKVLGTSGSTWI